jgi:nucleotide-binding universal stress UspA family protein
MGGVGMNRLIESLRESGKKILAKAVARAQKKNVRPKGILDESGVRSVADVIVRRARKWRSDLIVMGTHGRRGLSRLVMGSDAEVIVRSAPAPILLVREKTKKAS